jgi:hypothetical protein
MRKVLRVIGVLMFVMGTIWILQGANILTGNFMSGQIMWAYSGGCVAALGILFFYMARTRTPKTPEAPSATAQES